MAVRKRVSRNRDGEPQVVIRVTGATDVFRFATGMLGMQTEFSHVGRKTLRSLRETIGRTAYADLDAFLNGRHRHSRGPGPKVRWFVLRGGRIRHAVQGNHFTVSSRIVALCGRSGLVRSPVDDPADLDAVRPCPTCAPRARKLEEIP